MTWSNEETICKYMDPPIPPLSRRGWRCDLVTAPPLTGRVPVFGGEPWYQETLPCMGPFQVVKAVGSKACQLEEGEAWHIKLHALSGRLAIHLSTWVHDGMPSLIVPWDLGPLSVA